MATRRKTTPAIGAEDTMDSTAGCILRYYYGRMLECERDLAERWDPAAVHDMRVATRRTWTAFSLLLEPRGGKTIKLFSRWLRELGSYLGKVRDLDVFLDFATECQANTRSTPSWGLVRLESDLKEGREECRISLASFLAGSSHRTCMMGYGEWLAGDIRLGVRKTGKRSCGRMIPALLDAYRERVLSLGSALRFNTTPEEYHQMRVCCKRMRYAMEFFTSCYGDRLQSLIRIMIDVQDNLGRVHDADVQLASVRGYIKKKHSKASKRRHLEGELEPLIDSEVCTKQDSLSEFHRSWPESRSELEGIDFSL